MLTFLTEKQKIGIQLNDLRIHAWTRGESDHETKGYYRLTKTFFLGAENLRHCCRDSVYTYAEYAGLQTSGEKVYSLLQDALFPVFLPVMSFTSVSFVFFRIPGSLLDNLYQGVNK